MRRLEHRLNKVNVLWRPSACDSGNANEWLVGEVWPRCRPDVIVVTDDRWAFDGNWDIPDRFALTNGSVLSRRKVTEYARLTGLTSDLSMPMGDACFSPDTGRAIEYEYTIMPQDGEEPRERKVRVVYVVAESVEFMLKFLLPNRIRVIAICSKGYHIGFNGSRSTGWWLSRAAAALGARWQISDAVEYERTGRPVHDNDETLAVYPQIADMRMPNLGMHVDSRLHDETRIWEVDPIWECDRLPMSAR